MYEKVNEEKNDLSLQVLPLRNHHIIILALFPKVLCIEMTGWGRHRGVTETQFNACDPDQFYNTSEVVLVQLSQFAIV